MISKALISFISFISSNALMPNPWCQTNQTSQQNLSFVCAPNQYISNSFNCTNNTLDYGKTRSTTIIRSTTFQCNDTSTMHFSYDCCAYGVLNSVKYIWFNYSHTLKNYLDDGSVVVESSFLCIDFPVNDDKCRMSSRSACGNDAMVYRKAWFNETDLWTRENSMCCPLKNKTLPRMEYVP